MQSRKGKEEPRGGEEGKGVNHIFEHLFCDCVGAVELEDDVVGEYVFHYPHTVLCLCLCQLHRGRALGKKQIMGYRRRGRRGGWGEKDMR